jgi:hypothetical protein
MEAFAFHLMSLIQQHSWLSYLALPQNDYIISFLEGRQNVNRLYFLESFQKTQDKLHELCRHIHRVYYFLEIIIHKSIFTFLPNAPNT